ncbi:MAG TPA: hypothetical protein VIO61_05505 [Anaerolineaceae bacterium]
MAKFILPATIIPLAFFMWSLVLGFQASAIPLEHGEFLHGQWLGFLSIKPEP